MYEEYYEPLPDVEAYLKRIGMKRPTELTKEYLDQLVFAHQCAVTFENIDVYLLDKPISIAVQDLHNKIIVNKRGGYCFELNGLFVKLLKELGFDAYSCPCRVTMFSAPDAMLGPVMHRGNIVNLNGKKLFCDVGFGGPMPGGSLEMTDGLKQVLRGETFWFEQVNEYWYKLRRLVKNEETGEMTEGNLLLVSEAMWEPVDFIFSNRVCSEGPNAAFKRTLMVNVCYENGHASLTPEQLTIVRDGKKTVTEYKKEDLNEILKEHFHIEY